MVELQIKARGISDERELNAFQKVRRHLFIPKTKQNLAYEDHPLAIGHGQTISQPYMVALMVSLLDLNKNDTVLEIGTGSGYQTAILANLAKQVYTIERFQALADQAKLNLQKDGVSNYQIQIGDGTKGWNSCGKEQMRFNAIIVSAAANNIPETLKNQLSENGKLVIPVGSRFSQNLIRIIRKNNQFKQKDFGGCMFVPLIGKYSWQK